MIKKDLELFLKYVRSADISDITADMPNWNSDRKKAYILYSIGEHRGKMQDMPSISTSCLHTGTCIKRHAVKGSICEHCYSWNMLTASKNKALARKCELNTYFYRNIELTPNDIPFLNYAYFRFESFGEISNALQCKNYMTIARYNAHCNFTLWTKNPGVFDLALYGTIQPLNFRVIVSDMRIDREHVASYAEETKIQYPFMSALFTVVSKGSASKDTARIEKRVNCALQCNTCLKCYRPIVDRENYEIITELLK